MNDKDMYKAFVEDHPEYIGVVSKHSFKKHKPKWIHPPEQQ
jgi:hypothetical protein